MLTIKDLNIKVQFTSYSLLAFSKNNMKILKSSITAKDLINYYEFDKIIYKDTAWGCRSKLDINNLWSNNN